MLRWQFSHGADPGSGSHRISFIDLCERIERMKEKERKRKNVKESDMISQMSIVFI